MCSHVETYTQCQILFCYTDGFIYAGRDIPVSRNSLTCYTARHLRIRHLVQFILADPVYYNALTNCAARVMPRLRRVARMCSSTLSVNCEKAEKDTLW